MIQSLAQLGQFPESDGEGRGLLQLLIMIVVFVVLPLANSIKDYFVKRAERLRAEQQAQRDRLPVPPTDRPEKPLPDVFLDLPTGRVRIPMGEPDARTSQDIPPIVARPAGTVPPIAGRTSPEPRQPPDPPPSRPRATPADVARRRSQQQASPPSPPPVAKPVGRQHVQAKGQQSRPEQARRRGSAPARSAETKSAAKGQTLGMVHVRDTDPSVDIHGSDRLADDRFHSPAEPGLLLSSFVGLSRQEMRRAIVLSEILQPPLSLRKQPGGR